MRRKQLPDRPSAGWFQQCLGAVVARMRAETDATIGLLSLPVLGQQLDGAAAPASQAYSRMIAEIAASGEVAYLPLHERRIEELRQADPPPISYREVTPAAGLGVLVQHAVLRRSLDTISRRRGLVLTTDHIHQNSRGASRMPSTARRWHPIQAVNAYDIRLVRLRDHREGTWVTVPWRLLSSTATRDPGQKRRLRAQGAAPTRRCRVPAGAFRSGPVLV